MMIALFTDFGPNDIYVKQLKVALLRHAAAGATLTCSEESGNANHRR